MEERLELEAAPTTDWDAFQGLESYYAQQTSKFAPSSAGSEQTSCAGKIS
jgi:hypothetical protein